MWLWRIWDKRLVHSDRRQLSCWRCTMTTPSFTTACGTKSSLCLYRYKMHHHILAVVTVGVKFIDVSNKWQLYSELKAHFDDCLRQNCITLVSHSVLSLSATMFTIWLFGEWPLYVLEVSWFQDWKVKVRIRARVQQHNVSLNSMSTF